MAWGGGVFTLLLYCIRHSVIPNWGMYYIDFVAFMENPNKIWNNIWAKKSKKPHQNLLFSIRGLTFWKKKSEA